MQRVEPLTDIDLRTERFLALLREAAGQDDNELRRLISDVIPTMESVGVKGDAGLVAFGTYRLGTGAKVLEYLAVDDLERGCGRATALIRFIHELHPTMPLIAETDDDAVGFYRRLHFRVEDTSSDPRWPDRPRYRCTLPPLSAAQRPRLPGSDGR